MTAKAFEARELTVREVRDWLTGLETPPDTLDLVGEMLVEDCTLADIARMSNHTRAELDDRLPSEIADFARQCKAANPHFFAMRARLLAAGARAQALLQAAGPPPAPASPAPSSMN